MLALATAGSLFVIVAVVTAAGVTATGDLGIDFAFYREVGVRWLTDGTYYLPHQLAGPYDVALMVDVLYPPAALLLFVPFAVLPAGLWWAVPIALTAWVIAGWRPSKLGVAGMLLLLAWPRAVGAFLFGNTDMWMMAGVAAGLRYGWPAVFVLLKPTLAPFALVGIRSPTWWVALAVGIGFVAISWPLWLDYIDAMRNLRIGLEYSLGAIPLTVLPVVAWLARSRDYRGDGPRAAPAAAAGTEEDA